MFPPTTPSLPPLGGLPVLPHHLPTYLPFLLPLFHFVPVPPTTMGLPIRFSLLPPFPTFAFFGYGVGLCVVLRLVWGGPSIL